MQDFFQQVIANLKNTSLLEFIAVVSGIVSVWFSRKENIWVYPTGLINTVIYIYLSLQAHLVGEASVNFYYTVMSIYGWWLWARKDVSHKPLVHITFSNKTEWLQEIIFFVFFYVTLFFILTYLRRSFPGVIPWADAFASATAYTGMWLMARKKVESWWWWILTNAASIPLYYVKGLAFTSVYYIVLLVMAVFGLIEWKRRAKESRNAFEFETA
ncbi:nicotinamide riboside transporter PnuC [Flavisolibacter ginsenosidimutans]|uniref:Nicotinamide riboside transporter PnuC n=1 Tax=Flavisolibacter ginsenosidimutans TaxID=661481 RepID=A0A5B8UKU3_9BACT|nr:nicotinamide riboside transporter PnuC [Flavisolibacter ginsenosidimutans]QEC57307.1 nicotinamide mononucleotide transporter [Flavisolibacter ginsenosidimutans]